MSLQFLYQVKSKEAFLIYLLVRLPASESFQIKKNTINDLLGTMNASLKANAFGGTFIQKKKKKIKTTKSVRQVNFSQKLQNSLQLPSKIDHKYSSVLFAQII